MIAPTPIAGMGGLGFASGAVRFLDMIGLTNNQHRLVMGTRRVCSVYLDNEH
jgi:hypothetical protein